ncbi:MAG: DUF1844 domain-containing protein [Candidatus Omnitrophica bacterium]|nr:DUF1844 domain-containing protein [Candidatus Omnitrophota bacterium]
MEDKEKNLFPFLVSFLATWGWQALGKLPDPITGKGGKNLQQAKQVIDILVMLREKTRGNLSAEETRLIESAIADLQLNYVEETARETQARAQSQKQTEAEGKK